MNRRLLLKLVVAAVAALPLALPAAAAEKVTVFAAASLKNALDAANAAWSKETGNETTVSYAASSALAKQIEAAAPADLFISADLAWIIGAAFAPLVALYLSAQFGLLAVTVYLLSGVACTLGALNLNRRMERRDR